MQLLCDQNFNCLPCRWTPITTVNDGESYGSRVGRLGQTGHYKRVCRYLSGGTSHNPTSGPRDILAVGQQPDPRSEVSAPKSIFRIWWLVVREALKPIPFVQWPICRENVFAADDGVSACSPCPAA